MENLNRELLDVTVSLSGADLLKRMKKSALVIFFIGCINSALMMSVILIRTARFSNTMELLREKHPFSYFEFRLYIPFAIFYLSFFVFQLFFAWRFAKKANLALEIRDSEMFNASFALMVRANRIGVVSLAVNMLMGVLSLLAALGT